MRSLRAFSVGALLCLAGCFPHTATSTSATTEPQASPTPAVAPSTPLPSPSPRASAASLSTAPVYVIKGPKAVVEGTPVPLPSVTPFNAVRSLSSKRVKRAAPPVVVPSVPAQPHILAIHISTLEIHSGETVSGYVTTSKNVSSVDIHISAWSMPLPKSHDGLFTGSGVIPDLPFFVKGNYTLRVIALAPSGATTERDIPISLR